jgi:DNA-binding beta-propeller fold protein YncE
MRILFAFVVVSCLLLASGNGKYEVWAIDQSNSPGKSYGGTLYIWDGHDLEQKHKAATAPAEKIDLSGDVSAFCFARTGANPVRPHMVAINPSQTHAIISFVASGHIVFLNAETRMVVDCIRASAGDGGARQVHFAMPSPDETYLSVANQNGKLLERINTHYPTNTFTLDTAAGINLATCTTPNGLPCQYALRPDNAPICPVIETTSRYTFVTLRGGGLFVVDSKATPMKIVGEYDTNFVAGNGCSGVEVTGVKMYIGSGAGSLASNPHQADLYAFPVTGYSPSNPPNIPARKLVFREEVDPADAHGPVLTKGQKYLWLADRGRNFLWVVDTKTDEIVNRIFLMGGLSSDPTPDLLAASPNFTHVYMTLRGPAPLSGDPHVSTGTTPGVGIIKIIANGRDGVFESIAPISNADAAGVERADPHALAIRVPPSR